MPSASIRSCRRHAGRSTRTGRCSTTPHRDRWGQTLLRATNGGWRRRRGAGRERCSDRRSDVDRRRDAARPLRFKEAGGGPFLTSTGRKVPPVVDLPRLLAATTRVIDDRESEEDLRLILAPGTSLGGARPKATVRDTDGSLSIAKFPRGDDEWPVTRWEAATMALAQSAGVAVAPFELREAASRAVLTARRFDRYHGRRVPFMSALTALEASDSDHAQLSGTRRVPAARGCRGEPGSAPALAQDRVQHAGFQHRRPSTQSRLPARPAGMAAVAGIRPQPRAGGREATDSRARHRRDRRHGVARHRDGGRPHVRHRRGRRPCHSGGSGTGGSPLAGCRSSVRREDRTRSTACPARSSTRT